MQTILLMMLRDAILAVVLAGCVINAILLSVVLFLLARGVYRALCDK